jgi:hypothetical protein
MSPTSSARSLDLIMHSTLTQLLQTPYNSWIYRPAPITPAFLELDPIWDSLRTDPAFHKLCDKKQP